MAEGLLECHKPSDSHSLSPLPPSLSSHPHLTVLSQHDVVGMTVADTEDEGGDAVTSTRLGERINRTVVPAKTEDF